VQAAALAPRPVTLPRRRMHVPRVAAPRIRPAGMVIGLILVATLLGLVYLTQTLRSAAIGVETALLTEQRDALRRELLSQGAEISRARSQPAVEQWALSTGELDHLGSTLILADH
jgi:hypothetical protein